MELFSTIEEARASEHDLGYIPTRTGFRIYRRFGSDEGPINFDMINSITSPFPFEDVAEAAAVHSYNPPSPKIMSRIISIFRRVYEDFHSEMIVILNWRDGKYVLDRPKCATIGPGYLKYKQDGPNIGTIHSHAGGGAGFSYTDDEFEKTQPGIYMVLGNMNKRDPSIVASIAAMGKRYTIKAPELGIDSGVDLDYRISDQEYKWWMERTMLKTTLDGKTDGWFVLDHTGGTIWWAKKHKQLDRFDEAGMSIVSYDEKVKRALALKDVEDRKWPGWIKNSKGVWSYNRDNTYSIASTTKTGTKVSDLTADEIKELTEAEKFERGLPSKLDFLAHLVQYLHKQGGWNALFTTMAELVPDNDLDEVFEAMLPFFEEVETIMLETERKDEEAAERDRKWEEEKEARRKVWENNYGPDPVENRVHTPSTLQSWYAQQQELEDYDPFH